MRANAREREPGLLRHDVYAWQWENNAGPVFVNHDGPPYANGAPHMGHALNKILKDIITRERIMRGNRVSYIPGWDCHGLPIELKAVELLKKEKLTAANAAASEESALAVRRVARKYAETQIAAQKAVFMQFGVLGDWEAPYVTMSAAYEAAQLAVFHAMVAKGLIYRGLKPVHWSPSTRTALCGLLVH